MIDTTQKQFCFAILAVGKCYREHAKVLSTDIQKHCPNIPLIVLTDKPKDFAIYPQVLAFFHRLESVKGYHDKRFVIEKALTLFDSCMMVDADMRILGTLPQRDYPSGILARTGCNVSKHNSKKNLQKTNLLIKKIAKQLDIDLEKTYWFHEFMFVVTKQNGNEWEFLRIWELLADCFEREEIYNGEGTVMGLAAQKAGLTITIDREDKFPFFKDKIERSRIKIGQSNWQEKQQYFEKHRQIESIYSSSLNKKLDKLTTKLAFYYRKLRLKFLKPRQLHIQ